MAGDDPAVLVRHGGGLSDPGDVVAETGAALGKNLRGVFLVGPQENLLNVAHGMRRSPGEGFAAGVQRVNATPDETLARRVEASGAREVWLCLPLEMGSTVRHHVRLAPPDRRSAFPAGISGSEAAQPSHQRGGGALLHRLERHAHDQRRAFSSASRMWCWAHCSLISLPIGAVIAIILKYESRGPIVFKQYHRRERAAFQSLQVRPMEVHDEPSGQITQAKRGDPRVTPSGRSCGVLAG